MSCRSPNSTSPTRTTCCGHFASILEASSSDTSDTPDFPVWHDSDIIANTSQRCHEDATRKLLPWKLRLIKFDWVYANTHTHTHRERQTDTLTHGTWCNIVDIPTAANYITTLHGVHRRQLDSTSPGPPPPSLSPALLKPEVSISIECWWTGRPIYTDSMATTARKLFYYGGVVRNRKSASANSFPERQTPQRQADFMTTAFYGRAWLGLRIGYTIVWRAW